jgi:glutamate dehydrogenase
MREPSPTLIAVTACGARSSRPNSQRPSSTGAAPTNVTRLVDQTGADAPTIAAAYAATRDAFALVETNAAIDALDGQVPGRCSFSSTASFKGC